MDALTKWFPRRGYLVIWLACLLLILSRPGGAAPDTIVREAGLLRVEAPAGFESYAESVLSHATAAMRRLNQTTGDALMVQVRFIVAPDRAGFLKMAGGEGEHSLAVSLGGKQTVIISRPAMMKSGADQIQQVLTHELAHVYLDVRCDGFVPRWVHEGVAQVIAGEWTNAPGDASMALSAYTGGLIPLHELVSGFPRDEVQRNFAYAEAYSAVRFLVKNDYENSLRLFLGAISGPEGREVLRGLGSGVELAALQSRWSGDLRSPLHLTTLLLGSGLFWGFAAVLVIVAYVMVRRRSKLIRRKWAAEEAEAAEWNEPPDEAEWIQGDSTADDWEENQWQPDEEWEDRKWRGDP